MKATCENCGIVEMESVYSLEHRRKWFKRIRFCKVELICPSCYTVLYTREYALKKKRLYCHFDGKLYMAFENEDEVKDWGEKVLNPKWKDEDEVDDWGEKVLNSKTED